MGRTHGMGYACTFVMSSNRSQLLVLRRGYNDLPHAVRAVPGRVLGALQAFPVEDELALLANKLGFGGCALVCDYCSGVRGGLAGFQLRLDFIGYGSGDAWRRSHNDFAVGTVPGGTLGALQASSLVVVLSISTLALTGGIFVADDRSSNGWVYLYWRRFGVHDDLVVVGNTVSAVPLGLIRAFQTLGVVLEVAFWAFVTSRQASRWMKVSPTKDRSCNEPSKQQQQKWYPQPARTLPALAALATVAALTALTDLVIALLATTLSGFSRPISFQGRLVA